MNKSVSRFRFFQLLGKVGPGPAPKFDAGAGVFGAADGGIAVIDSTHDTTRCAVASKHTPKMTPQKNHKPAMCEISVNGLLRPLVLTSMTNSFETGNKRESRIASLEPIR